MCANGKNKVEVFAKELKKWQLGDKLPFFCSNGKEMAYPKASVDR